MPYWDFFFLVVFFPPPHNASQLIRYSAHWIFGLNRGFMEPVYIDPSFVVVPAVVVVLWLFCFLRGGWNYWKWLRGIRTDDCWLAAQKLDTSLSIAVQIWRNKKSGLSNRLTVEFSAQSIESERCRRSSPGKHQSSFIVHRCAIIALVFITDRHPMQHRH